MIDEARKALKKYQDIEYMMQTEGWKYFEEYIERELKWAFDKSISPDFRKEVKDKPETYFEHFGYCNGLKVKENFINKARVAGNKAKKDIEKWESKNNPAT